MGLGPQRGGRVVRIMQKEWTEVTCTSAGNGDESVK